MYQRNDWAGRQDRVGELEEGVGASTNAPVEPPAEVAKCYRTLKAVV